MKTLAILLTLILALANYAEIINVPDDHETIQGAIDAAEDGDTVMVAPGEYVENINFNGKAIVVIGNPDDPSDVVIDGNEAGSVVSFVSDEDERSVLQGLTITNGAARYGAGIYCRDSDNPTLTDLIIINNHAENAGGGMFLHINSSSISNVVLSDNISDGHGGGLCLLGSADRNPILRNVTISNNHTVSGGGGIYTGRGTALTLIDVTINDNSTVIQGGGGIYGDDPGPSHYERVIIKSNSSEGGVGGAIYFSSLGSVITMQNVTIANNEVGEERLTAGIYFHGGNGNEGIHLINSIMYGNGEINLHMRGCSLSVTYCNIEGGQDRIDNRDGEIIWGEGNIDEDPAFADPDEGDYHLTEDSPCIDTGDPDSPEDPDGTRADMGAYYFHQEMERVEYIDETLPTRFRIVSIHPNPFNSSTTVSYSLPQSQQLTVNLYDMSGRLIETLYDDFQARGHHSVVWDSREFGSGIYLVRVQTDKETEVAKLVAIK